MRSMDMDAQYGHGHAAGTLKLQHKYWDMQHRHCIAGIHRKPYIFRHHHSQNNRKLCFDFISVCRWLGPEIPGLGCARFASFLFLLFRISNRNGIRFVSFRLSRKNKNKISHVLLQTFFVSHSFASSFSVSLLFTLYSFKGQ
jgi:hypothetical protein